VLQTHETFQSLYEVELLCSSGVPLSDCDAEIEEPPSRETPFRYRVDAKSARAINLGMGPGNSARPRIAVRTNR